MCSLVIQFRLCTQLCSLTNTPRLAPSLALEHGNFAQAGQLRERKLGSLPLFHSLLVRIVWNVLKEEVERVSHISAWLSRGNFANRCQLEEPLPTWPKYSNSSCQRMKRTFLTSGIDLNILGSMRAVHKAPVFPLTLAFSNKGCVSPSVC